MPSRDHPVCQCSEWAYSRLGSPALGCYVELQSQLHLRLLPCSPSQLLLSNHKSLCEGSFKPGLGSVQHCRSLVRGLKALACAMRARAIPEGAVFCGTAGKIHGSAPRACPTLQTQRASWSSKRCCGRRQRDKKHHGNRAEVTGSYLCIQRLDALPRLARSPLSGPSSSSVRYSTR